MSKDDDYDSILDRSFDELPEEKLLPDGWYILRLRNATFMPPTEKASARVLFFYNVSEVLSDVDDAELAALGENYDISENEVAVQFWVERNRDWKKVQQHMELLGAATAGKSILDAIKGAKGSQIAAKLTTRTYEDANKTTQEQNSATEFAAVS